MISWRMAAAWVTALVVATVLTWQIVGLADSQVGEAPVAVAPSLTTTTDDGSSTTTSTSTTTDPGNTTTTPGAGTSSSADTSTSTSTGSSSSSTSSSSTSSSSTSSTSSTASNEQWSLRTITSTGGVVVVRYRPGEAELQAATPAPGFSVEVDDGGPPRVRVEFESEDVDARVEVRWDDGSLDVDVDDD